MSCSFPRPFAFLLLLTLALPAGAQKTGEPQLNQRGPVNNTGGMSIPSKQPTEKPPLLPPDFAGQIRNGRVETSSTPSDVDLPHAAVLQENGLVEADTARYGDATEQAYTLQVLRFGDATGALAAFTFYRDPSLRPETIGQNSVGNADALLVQQKNILVKAQQTSGPNGPGDPARMRSAVEAMLALLPTGSGPEGVLPTLTGLLPAEGLQKQTLHYAIGPASYNGPLPASLLDFSKDAEVATAAYRLRSGGQGILTLILVPTPQIAGATLRGIEKLTDPALHVAARRIGPLVGIVSGQGVPQADAQRLVNSITYVSDVTLDQPQGYTSEVAKAAKLLLGIGYIVVFLAIAALVLAVFFGAGRVIVRRLQGKPASSVSDDEFITLKL